MTALIATTENYLVRANDGLHRMRVCHAKDMLDFAEKDPQGFVQMIDASKALSAMIPPDVEKKYSEVKGKKGVS